MRKRRIHPKAWTYTFDTLKEWETHVHVLEGRGTIYVVDTFCGPAGMEEVRNAGDLDWGGKKVVVFNTHFHWDHVWGNGFFNGAWIVAHASCRKRLEEEWDSQIRMNGEHRMGLVEKVLPDLTFGESLFFPEDGLEVFHSPGHTADSISLFDRPRGILYVGDNLERPLPYVEDRDLDRYVATLERYRKLRPRRILAGHSLELDLEDLEGTIRYLRGLQSGGDLEVRGEAAMETHRRNLEFLG
ncbi:MBL fold metallo-hydrolase [Anaerotalea alkaliphila]|uniref:MBL fold metallo-hydrolase n=1 Tax=Anaerotalea alkaliphila TaxID=2662126 RepID=A0A7X5HVH9_9FIRM|nr:MBL fold metallo-hydrolase [Anaerotalea alkaliphila]NDL67417.1 MBL fold metallo-hydrolase [Anaerotalea alkaliphila]